MATPPSSNYVDFLKYFPAGGDLLLSRTVHTIYSHSSEKLYAIAELYLVEFDWNQSFSIFNDTNAASKKTFLTSLGLKVTEGSEVNAQFGLSASFQGIGINAGVSSKTFQSQELNQMSSVSTEITCSPNALTSYYQREYLFKTRVWYLLDAWGELSQVGGLPLNKQPNYTPTYSESSYKIASEDYILTSIALQGEGTFPGSASPEPAEVAFKWTRQFNNCTQTCQNYLKGLANKDMAVISGYNIGNLSVTSISSKTADANVVSDLKKNEGEGAELIGVAHPPDKTQAQIVSTTQRTSDAPPDEELPAAAAKPLLAALKIA